MNENDKSKQLWSVVAIGGKQTLVAEGSKFTVNKLDLDVNATVKVESLLDKLPVTLKVIAHKLGAKVNGLKFKNKVRYTRRYGHRQQLTELEVIAIGKPTVNDKKVSVNQDQTLKVIQPKLRVKSKKAVSKSKVSDEPKKEKND